MAGTVNTKVDMANLALSHLKEPAIQDFDYSSVASRWFLKNYKAKLDAALARADWDFAIKLTSLPADTVKPAFRWQRQFTLPPDLMRLPVQREDGDPKGRRIPVEVAGRKLMTDYGAPFPLRYVSNLTEEGLFSPLFVDAFSLYLAAGAAHVIAGKNSLVQTLADQAKAAFDEANTADAEQSEPEPIEEFEIVTCR